MSKVDIIIYRITSLILLLGVCFIGFTFSTLFGISLVLILMVTYVFWGPDSVEYLKELEKRSENE